MVLVKKPFRSYSLDEKDDTYKIISLRLNKQEQEQLEELKTMFDTDQDGTAIKTAMQVGVNVLHSTFGMALLKRLFSSRRVRK